MESHAIYPNAHITSMRPKNTDTCICYIKFVEPVILKKCYRLATKQCLLLGSYTRNQLEPTDSLFLKPSNMLADNFIFFRQAVRLNSICDGQGFQKCACSGKNRCEQNRCECRKADTNFMQQ